MKVYKINTNFISINKGFTLIELIVVVAIIGVLAAVLITIIDPLDKINAANDAGVISTVSQMGRSLSNYATVKNNSFPGPSSIGINTATTGLLPVLNSNGESKISSYAPPSGYTLTYYASPNASCTTAAQTCTGYALVVTGLKSKKYISASTPNYQFVNGKGCFVTTGTTITQANLDANPTNPANGC